MKHHQFYTIFLALLIIFTIPSCMDEKEENLPSGSNEGNNYTLTLDMPVTQEMNTYGIDAIDENYIRTIDVLVFKIDGANETFLYRVMGSNIANDASSVNGNKKNCNITLLKTTGAEQVRLVIIANSRFNLANPQEGETKQTVLQRMVFETGSNNQWPANSGYDFNPFPMWGESNVMAIDGITPISPVSLLRALAKIDIGLNYVGDVATGISGFNLNDIYVYNIKTKGKVVPDAANYSSGTQTVTAPSIPNESGISVNGPIHYVCSGYQSSNQIYLLESPAGIIDAADQDQAAPCIIIRTNAGYYKINILQTINGTARPIPILRNYRYKINIKSILGPGHPTLADALRAKAANDIGLLTTNITVYNDSKIFVSDGEYYLTVSKESFDFVTNQQASDNFIIETNYPEGWTASFGDPFLSLSSTSGPANVPQVVNLSVSALSSDTRRYAFFTVKAGRLGASITVYQGLFYSVPANSGGYTNPPYLVYLKPVPGDFDWYGINNVPFGVNTQDVPPDGQQLYPINKSSCAALNAGGYYNWRMPTRNEIAILYSSSIGSISPISSSTSAGNSAFFLYYSSSTYNKDWSNAGYYLGLQYIKCIRTANEYFYTKTGTEVILNKNAETKDLIVYLRSDLGGLQYAAGDGNFNTIISSATPIKVANVENGYEQWKLTLNTSTNNTGISRNTSVIIKSGSGGYSKTINLIQSGT